MSVVTAPFVGVGSAVTIRDLRNHDVFTLTIVPSGLPSALDPDQVRPDSIIAQALLGTRLNDTVSWPTPQGMAEFRITAIDRGTP